MAEINKEMYKLVEKAAEKNLYMDTVKDTARFLDGFKTQKLYIIVGRYIEPKSMGIRVFIAKVAENGFVRKIIEFKPDEAKKVAELLLKASEIE